MSCKIQVRIAPGGDVLDVKVIATSGDASFDRSAEAAVRKASPLHMPPDAKVAQELQPTFQFTFKPD
jgi:colicin import membrane protein